MRLYRDNERGRATSLIHAIDPFLPTSLRERGALTGPLFLRCAAQQLQGKAFDPDTLGPALLTFALAGILPNAAIGHGYLVPYSGKVTPVFGYKGLLELARRARPADGRVMLDGRDVVVVAGERFDPEVDGFERAILHHTPSATRDPRSLDGVEYAYAHFRYAAPIAGQVHEFHVVELMGRGELEAARDAAASKGGPWRTWPQRMAAKTPILRLCRSGRVPLGYLVGAVTEATQSAEAGNLAGYRDILAGALESARAANPAAARAPVGILEDGLAALDGDDVDAPGAFGDENLASSRRAPANGNATGARSGSAPDLDAYVRDVADIWSALESCPASEIESYYQRGKQIAAAHGVTRTEKLDGLYARAKREAELDR